VESFTRKPDALTRRLRAMVEIIDGQLKIYPIAESDEEAKEILDRLHLWRSNE
jgi:hypothetical protein